MEGGGGTKCRSVFQLNGKQPFPGPEERTYARVYARPARCVSRRLKKFVLRRI